MSTTKNAIRFVGALFLVQMTAAVISHMVLLSPILNSKDFLVVLSTHSSKVITAMLLDLVCGATVLGIAVILFPILKKHSEPIALWYFGLRLFEWIMVIISGIFLLTLLSLSKEYVNGPIPEHSYLLQLGNYLLEARDFTKVLMLLGFCLNVSLFYYLLFKSKLVPRFISVWGMIGVLLIGIEILSNIYGYSIGGIRIMFPMGLNEIFLGIWLMAKGFNPSAMNPDNSKTEINSLLK